jgi:hypothetical protein
MKTDTGKIKLEVQETLDELLDERLIPFKLTAHQVETASPGEYRVPFYDSRIHSISFAWRSGGRPAFKEVIRAAVLEGTKRMGASYDRFRASAWPLANGS